MNRRKWLAFALCLVLAVPIVLRSLPPTAVTVHAGHCFGTCPVFDLEAASDGTVDFTGKRFTFKLGRSAGLSPEGGYDGIVGRLSPYRPLFSTYPGPEDCPADGQFYRVIWWLGPVPTSSLSVGDGCKGTNNDEAIKAVWEALEFVQIEHYIGTPVERKSREAEWMKESL